MRRGRRHRARRAAAVTVGAAAILAPGPATGAINLVLTPTSGEIAPTVSGAGEFNGTPQVAMNDDGDIVVVWMNGGTTEEIWARPYNADGTPRAAAVRVASSTTSGLVDPSVAVDATGDFVVGWTQVRSTVSTGMVRRYTAAGVPATPTLALGTNVDGDVLLGRNGVAMDGAGNYTVAFTRLEGGNCLRVVVRRYTPNGTGTRADGQVGGDENVGLCLQFEGSLPAVASAADGRTVVAWGEAYRESVNNALHWSLRAQRLSATGAPVRTGNTMIVESFQYYADFGVGGLDIADDGSFVVAFRDHEVDEATYDPNPTAKHVFVKRFDAADVLTDTQRADTGSDRGVLDADVAVTNSGSRWLATWTDDRNRDGDGLSVRARSLARGQRGPVGTVNVNAPGDQALPAVAMGPRGDAVVAWQSTVPFEIDGGIVVIRGTATATLLRLFDVGGSSTPARAPVDVTARAYTPPAVEAESGAVPLSLDCPAQQAATCTVNLTATVATPGAIPSLAPVVVGRRTLTVRSGRVTRVRVPLSVPARAALLQRGRLTVELTVAGRGPVRRGTVTVLPPQTRVRATASGVVPVRFVRGGWGTDVPAAATLRSGGRVIARTPLRARSGVVQTVRMRLPEAQRRLLRAGRSVTATLVVAVADPRLGAVEDTFARVLVRRTVRVLPPG